MNKLVPVRIISVLKACRDPVNIGGNLSSQLTRIVSVVDQQLKSPRPPPQKLPSSHGGTTNPNPCLDLFYNVSRQGTPVESEANRYYLSNLLPLAWSHNPSTTLKLICNLLDRRCGGQKDDEEGFYTAAFWLHCNHPKTLASNLLPISGLFGGLCDLVDVLRRILAGVPVRGSGSSDQGFQSFEDKMYSMANKVAAERYRTNTDYQFLHDRISDLFVHCLQRDIQILKKHRRRCVDDADDYDESNNKNEFPIEITLAASDCEDDAAFLCESIGRRIFPPPPEGGGEANYGYRARQRLRKEVLKPLRKPFLGTESGYHYKYDRKPCAAYKLLSEDVMTQSSPALEGRFKVVAGGALLPHQIVWYVDDENVGQAAELKWKAMVEDMKKNNVKEKKGNLSNSLAVCDVEPDRTDGVAGIVSVGLGLLVAELNQEPAWKGKVVNFSRNPKLHCLLGLGDDLKSKCAFLRRMECEDSEVDFNKVFDLILEVAAKGNLKPEQMIKKVFVFTTEHGFDEASGFKWESDYQAIQSKFEEKGYGNVVPEIVFWDVKKSIPLPCRKHGAAMFGGYSDHLVKSFLDNDGEMGPEEVMEAEIAGQPYQTLLVVD